jgi:hypothetical protein
MVSRVLGFSLSQLKIRCDYPSIVMVRTVSPLCSCSSAHSKFPNNYVVYDPQYAANVIIRPDKCAAAPWLSNVRNIILTRCSFGRPAHTNKYKKQNGACGHR